MPKGHLLIKTHLKGGAYSKGGASWKEDAKSNLYGTHRMIISLFVSFESKCLLVKNA